jgi:hypothetical protein
MTVHHLNRCKERHILLAGMHMSKLLQEITQTTLKESPHILYTREIFALQIFMRLKTEDINFILNLGEKLSVIHPTLFSFLSIFL